MGRGGRPAPVNPILYTVVIVKVVVERQVEGDHRRTFRLPRALCASLCGRSDEVCCKLDIGAEFFAEDAM